MSEASRGAVWEPPQAGLILSSPPAHQALCAPSAILGSLRSPQPRGVWEGYQYRGSQQAPRGAVAGPLQGGDCSAPLEGLSLSLGTLTLTCSALCLQGNKVAA